MKLSKLFFVIALGFGSCDNDAGETCGVTDPLNDLPWLKEEIQSYSSVADYAGVTISQGKYRHRTVFISAICCSLCNTAPPSVKSCTGEFLGYLGTDVDSSIQDGATVIWRTSNGGCP